MASVVSCTNLAMVSLARHVSMCPSQAGVGLVTGAMMYMNQVAGGPDLEVDLRLEEDLQLLNQGDHPEPGDQDLVQDPDTAPGMSPDPGMDRDTGLEMDLGESLGDLTGDPTPEGGHPPRDLGGP